jgi:hypothetical protein
MLQRKYAADAEMQRRNALLDLDRQELQFTQQQAVDKQQLQKAYAAWDAGQKNPQYRSRFAAQVRQESPQETQGLTDEEIFDMAGKEFALALGITPEAPKPQRLYSTAEGFLPEKDAIGKMPYQAPQRAPQSRAAAPAAAPGAPAKPANPLPVGALKIVDEAKQASAAASDSKTLIDNAIELLERGDVQLGAVRNMESRGRNFAGNSDENSRAYASLRQTLEKLRNNYLLLAKGVQTEGDAARAWNSEIGESVQNDNALALQQLQKAQAMIDRALAAQQSRIETVYGNYGGSPPASGAPAGNAAPAVGGQLIIRNPKTGERKLWIETENGGVWQLIQ